MIPEGTDPVAAPPTKPPRIWLLPMLGLVVATLVALELAYARWPVPPGVDPADWIQRSYAWVGLPAVTPDAVGSPYLYPPVMFPLLGLTVRATGGAVPAALAFGGFLLVLYGLTTIHLARRLLRSGPTQLLFVGLAVLNGTTLQMLFWGGYPNFLALAFANEALILLFAYVQGRRTLNGIGFFALLSLIYLTHDLTFVILTVASGVAVILWTLQDRSFLRILYARGTLLGAGLLAATVGIYSATIRYLGIETPGYFGANPAAYVLNDLGQFFRPLSAAPMFLPAGPTVLLLPLEMLAILVGSVLLVLGMHVLLDRRWSRHDPRWTIAAGLLVSALAIPSFGWLAHADTDYTRFVYFLPLPLALGFAFLVEELWRTWAVRGEGSEAGAVPAGTSPELGRDAVGALRWPPRSGVVVAASVGVVVLLMFGLVAIPTISSSEQADAGPSHDAAFLDALQFLASDPNPGCVLTLQSSIRWVEAVSSRGAFDVGPTWLLFEPWQIVNAEETYWAFNARYALTNNLDVLSLSGAYAGADTSPLTSAPLYSGYVNGVAVPILNFQPGKLYVSANVGGVNQSEPAGFWGPPTLSLAPGGSAGALLEYVGPYYNLSESVTVPPSGGSEVVITADPAPGVTIQQIGVGISAPSYQVALLHAPTPAGVSYQAGILHWSVETPIGPQVNPTRLTTQVSFSPSPTRVSLLGPSTTNSAMVQFPGARAGSTSVRLNLTTPGLSNPAVHLPAVLDTAQFLSEHQIRFMLMPSKGAYAFTTTYYQLLFGWHTVYSNPEWSVSAA